MKEKKSAKISTLGSQVTSVVSVSLVLILLGALAIIFTGARNAISGVRSEMALVIRVMPGLEEYEINPIKQELGNAPYSAGYSYLTAEQVLSQESALMGDSTFELLDENPYSAEFEVKLAPDYVNPDSIKMVTERLQRIKAVDDIDVPVNVAGQVDNSLHKITLVLGGVALALLIISIVLINNTVSLSIYARRFIIHTMKLVGATRGFIRRPFVGAGAVCGLIAGMIAAAVLAGVYAYLCSADVELSSNLTNTELAVILVTLPIAGIAICALTAYCAANRYLNKRYDQLFKK